VLWNNNKPVLKNESEVKAIIEKIKDRDFTVSDVRATEKTIRPKAPFTTSQLQQTAANKLGFTSRKTMQVAQQLYEGVGIGASRVGLITYMRTDSVRISQTALEDVRTWLEKNHPKELPEKPIEYTVGKNAQDAHEAIRPTYTEYTPDSVKENLSKDQLRLYSIIWERFVSSQMTNAKSRTVSLDIKVVADNEEGLFRVSGTKLVEKGFYNVIKLLSSKEENTGSCPSLEVNDKVKN